MLNLVSRGEVHRRQQLRSRLDPLSLFLHCSKHRFIIASTAVLMSSAVVLSRSAGSPFGQLSLAGHRHD